MSRSLLNTSNTLSNSRL